MARCNAKKIDETISSEAVSRSIDDSKTVVRLLRPAAS